MTDQNAIAKLVQDYSENEKAKTAIANRLQDLGHQLRTISELLSNRHMTTNWEQGIIRNFSISESGIILPHHGRNPDLPLNAIEEIANLVTQLKTVMERKSRMEQQLGQANLGNLIQRN